VVRPRFTEHAGAVAEETYSIWKARKMAIADMSDLGRLAEHVGPSFFAEKIRADVKLLWLLQDRDKRTADDLRKVFVDTLDSQLKDLENIVKGL
jgi:hypothetical protein